MSKKLILTLFIVSCFSCRDNNIENIDNQHSELSFNKEKWAVKTANDYPYRDRMLNDLITHIILKGLTKTQVTALLGAPDRTDNNYLFYTITQERIGFFPLHTKTLVIKLSKEGTVVWRKIHQ